MAQTWTGNTSTDWTVAGNWGGTVPTTGAVAINTTSPNPAVLGVAGAATGTSGNLAIGSGGTGSLTIQNGSTLTTSGTGFSYIGANGSTGTMTVTGAGSEWILNGSPAAVSVIFGQTETASSGTLNISNGGAVTTAGDFAGGNVTLNVTGGGTLTTGRDAYLGRLAGANATATISGAGSQWTIASRLLVGNGGTGALTVSNSATVDVATSTTVGDSAGQGTLTITSGGVLQTPTLIRGTGPVQVTFDNATLRAKVNSATFITGFTGTQLNIASGGLTIDTADFNVTAASPFSGAGALTKTGAGALSLSGAQPYTGTTTVGAGRLVLSNVTGFVSATTVNSGATLAFTGTTSVTSAAAITLNDGAVLENSNTSGTTVLSGAVTSTGNTSINLNTPNTGQGLFLDGGLKGSGTVTINPTNAGNAVKLRNNNSSFSGTLIVNGIANGTAGAGSGLAIGGPSTSNALINANVVVNGTVELADQGFGSGFSTSNFNLGALSGSGIIIGNRNPAGNFGSRITLGNTNDSGLFSGRILRGSGITNVVGITKVGTGTQIFSGANGYTGTTIVNVGVLNIQHNSALGTTAAGTSVTSGAALQMEGGITIGAEALTLNGTGIANDGALRNISGVNSYAGPITLGSAARINSDADMLTLNAITGAAQNLTLGGAGGTTITGAIGITSGTLTKDGSGTAILAGTNTYTGGTTISAGTLQLGNGGAAGSIIGDVMDNGAMAFNRTDTYTFSGLISGSGALDQIGGGTIILTADNSYTGPTTIAAGILQIGDGGTSGSIAGDVTNNAALVFNRSNAASLGGAISGTGTVSQIGAGTTTLTGVNSYSGGTTISAGTLAGSATSFGPGAILDDAALVIDQPADAAFANAINGAGSFTKLGAGRLNYTGTGGLTGTTTVAAGTLAVNGSLASSAVTVQNGGTLGGNGTVGATSVQSGGAIAPGNSIGTLHVNGAFVQNAGSVYQVEVDPNTNASDLIAVTGPATLQSGAGLNAAKVVPGDYRIGTVYTVLTSTGLTGTYALSGQTQGVSAFLALKDTYDANNAYLTVVQTQQLAAVAQPGNQQAVAEAIESLPQADPIPVAVLNLPDVPAAQSAFDQLSGQIQASAKSALVAHALYVRDATFDRLRDSYCDEERRERPRPGCSWDGPSLWGQGYGGWGGVAANGSATGLNHATAGFLLGVDVPVAGWRAGVFGGRSRSDLQLVRTDAEAESTEFHLGAYAGTRWDDISLRLGASYSWDSITANRTVAFGTFSDRLRSVYNAGASQGFAELGYRVEMWETMFEPFANLAYVNVRTDGFREVGGPAALAVRADTLENLISTLGVRPSTEVIVDGAELTLRGLAGWRHTFGSVAPGSTVAFAGGNDFTITGAPVARDAMALEAGVDFTVRDNVSAGLTYGSQLSSKTTDQTVRGTVRVSF